MLLEKFYYMLKFSPFLQNLAKRALFKLPHREIIVCHYGQKLKVDLSELSGFYLYFEKEYDDYIFDFLNKRISKYERVIDVGANIGIYSIYFGARAKRVDSFEPVPEIANKLVYNINLNELKNVIVHKACVGEKSGKVSFILPSKANQGIGRISFEDGDIIELPCISLDDFLGGVLDEPTLIKIDIEGAELLALTGAKKTLANRKNKLDILLEIHPREIINFGGSIIGLKSLLEGVGLRVYGLTNDGLAQMQKEDNFRFWWASDEY